MKDMMIMAQNKTRSGLTTSSQLIWDLTQLSKQEPKCQSLKSHKKRETSSKKLSTKSHESKKRRKRIGRI